MTLWIIAANTEAEESRIHAMWAEDMQNNPQKYCFNGKQHFFDNQQAAKPEMLVHTMGISMVAHTLRNTPGVSLL